LPQADSHAALIEAIRPTLPLRCRVARDMSILKN
jgi:hypothetical protein